MAKLVASPTGTQITLPWDSLGYLDIKNLQNETSHRKFGETSKENFLLLKKNLEIGQFQRR